MIFHIGDVLTIALRKVVDTSTDLEELWLLGPPEPLVTASRRQWMLTFSQARPSMGETSTVANEPELQGVRIAELVATLSYAADLGLGQPMAHCIRQTVLALQLADLVGASAPEREAVYYLGLMMNVYCHADAAEQARWFGDDIAMKGDGFEMLDMSTAHVAALILRRLNSQGSRSERAKRLAAFAVSGRKFVTSFLTTHSTLGAQFAERIGLSDEVCIAIRQAYEQWDGKGYPHNLAGDEIGLPARLVHLASPIEVHSRRRGVESAKTITQKNRGTVFDPAIADVFLDHAAAVLERTTTRPTGMPSWLPNRLSGAGSPAGSSTTSCWRWPTSST